MISGTYYAIGSTTYRYQEVTTTCPASGSGLIPANTVDNGSGGFNGPTMNPTALQATVNCATSGTVTFSQPFQGSSYKMAIAYANACSGAASYTFPTAFTNTPEITGALSSIGSATTTTWTVTGTTSTGFLKADGY